jgi:LuxR family maltose regulon positive regulatory protein
VEALHAEAGTDEPDRGMAAAVAMAWVHVERYSLVEGRDWVTRAAARGRHGTRGPEEAALAVVLAVLQSRSLRLRREYEAADECLRTHLADEPVPRWARRDLLAEAARVALARGRVHDAVLLADGDGVDPATRDRIHALARLMGGDGGDGPPLEVADDGPATAVECRVLRACQLAEAGAVPAAAEELVRALDLARPELLRLPFLEAPAQARRLLRTHPRLAGPARWLDPSIPVHAVARGADPAATPVDEEPALTQELSERETEVLQHLAEMLSTSEIAATMFISVNTVRTHIRSILRKLGVSRRNQAVRRARERGLL